MRHYCSSPNDVTGARRLVSLDLPELAKHYDELFGAFDGINAMHWDITQRVILPFVVSHEDELYGELKKRLSISLDRKDAEVLEIYIWFILRNWRTQTLAHFHQELHDIVRLGPVPGEEHDLGAAFLMLSRGMEIEADVKAKLPEMLKQFPGVAAGYGVQN